MRSRSAASCAATASAVRNALWAGNLREVEAREHRGDLRQGDRRSLLLQAARHLRRRRSGMAQQRQEHLDDDGRFQRGGLALSDPGLALATQRLPPHRGEQERMHGHVQQGAQFLLRAPGSGLAHQALHGGAEGAVAGEVDVAQGHEPVAVEAQPVAEGVVAAVVVVAAQVADLLEIAEGGGARSIAERGLELGEGDGRAGGQQGGQHGGGAPSHDETVYNTVPQDIQTVPQALAPATRSGGHGQHGGAGGPGEARGGPPWQPLRE